MTPSTAHRKEASLSSLIKQADKVFSLYIRSRDVNKQTGRINCFICGTSLTVVQACCGHFIRRDQMPTRFDERNAHSLCYSCNNSDEYSPLTQAIHKDRVIETHGLEVYEELRTKSKGLMKPARYEIGEIIAEYEAKIKAIK